MKRTRKPSHPGAAFRSLVIDELEITISEAARLLGVTRSTLSTTLNERSSLSPGMAKRWGKLTDTSTASWYNMQVALDLWEIENSEIGEDIKPYTRQS